MKLYRCDGYSYTYYMLCENGKLIRANRYLFKYSSIRVLYEQYNISLLDHVKNENDIKSTSVKLAEFECIEDLKDLFPEEFI